MSYILVVHFVFVCLKLNLLHSERPKLYTILAFLSAIGLMLVGCLGLNSSLRQYFSLYRAISQREGERKEK